MNARSISITIKTGLLVGAYGLLSGLAMAQSLPGGISNAAAAATQLAFVNSKALFAAKNFAQAEVALETGNKQKPGTPQWNVESGFGLLRMAFDFQGKGDGPTAVVAAQRALVQLTQAKQKFSGKDNPAEIANQYELAGIIYEQLLGDRNAAETNYAMAASLAPKSGQAASLLAKLRAAKAEEQKKISK